MSRAWGCTRRSWLAACAFGPGLAGAQAAQVTLTLLEGPAALVIGAQAFDAQEGLRLAAGTLIETGANTGLLRLEAADGSLIDLGPGSRALLQPARRGTAAPGLYLLSGWVKLQSGAQQAHGGLLSPQVELESAQGSVVLQVSSGLVALFCESGSVKLIERTGAKARQVVTAGASYQRQGGKGGELLPRPDPAWLRTVPRAFRDPIPPRLARFSASAPTPAAQPAPRYENLAAWLQGEPSLRREFPRRFAPLLRDPAFRAEVAKNLGAHPEWEPVLFPERFVKPASAPGARP